VQPVTLTVDVRKYNKHWLDKETSFAN